MEAAALEVDVIAITVADSIAEAATADVVLPEAAVAALPDPAVKVTGDARMPVAET